VLLLHGMVGNEARQSRVGVGKAARAKHQFRADDRISERAESVPDQRLETAEYYKASVLKVLERIRQADSGGPPWLSIAPTLEVYRDRGHRRLHPTTYEERCISCVWGCRMPVEIIADH